MKIRLSELIGSLSLATDLAAGLGPEAAMKTSLIATHLGRRLGLGAEALREVHYAALLRFIGCSAYSHEAARLGGGDDLAYLQAMTPGDASRPMEMLARIVTRVGRGQGALRRAGAVARGLVDPGVPRKLAAAHCELAQRLAAQLGMSAGVLAALQAIYERFDGRGFPSRLRGEQIPLAARLTHVAWRAEAHRGLEGGEAAKRALHARAGGELDPALAALFLEEADELLGLIGRPSVWDEFLAAEPAPFWFLPAGSLEAVARAFGHFADVKSIYTYGHSEAVSRLALAAAAKMGLPEAEQERLRIAALLHDLGMVSVPNGILEKTGALGPLEWERVRQHPYHTERILARTELLKPYASLAAGHHERPDGGGYHRGSSAPDLERPARVLAAAQAYQSMLEARPYRPALGASAAAKALGDGALEGRWDVEAVEAVLAAAGLPRNGRLKGALPAGLSGREGEVLALIAQGLTNKEAGQALGISARTVQAHLARIFEKCGVSTRAAAAVYALENGLLRR